MGFKHVLGENIQGSIDSSFQQYIRDINMKHWLLIWHATLEGRFDPPILDFGYL